MSVFNFTKERPTFPAASICGSARSGRSASETLPEDPVITKSRKKLYGISARKAPKQLEDSQLVVFDPEVMHFLQWKTRFQRLLESRGIDDEETKKSVLLKALLPKTVGVILTLFRRHEEPFDKDTEVILAKLQDFYEKIERKNRIKARIQFFSTVQSGAHFYEFANSLKDQLFDCDFGAFEEDALIMCFVMGLDNPVLRKHMLEKELWLTSLIATVELALKFQEVLPSGPFTYSESVCELRIQNPSSCYGRSTNGYQ